ncbi:MAG: hypothetical protein GVY22_17015 [Gammaproteobacteria bacterium]|nr:hypothetical protein [Gammaproteobacteria bacterium]
MASMKTTQSALTAAEKDLSAARETLAQFEQDQREAERKAAELREQKKTAIAEGAEREAIHSLDRQIADADAEVAAHRETIEMQHGVVASAETRLADAQERHDRASSEHWAKIANERRSELVRVTGKALADLFEAERKSGSELTPRRLYESVSIKSDIVTAAEQLAETA